ncbi:MAG: methyltransferase domain-containing protein [Verrucomicrobia bacterium]|nr:methyltransferase domain-containing protein [Verrucomicrobiota bacterium]
MTSVSVNMDAFRLSGTQRISDFLPSSENLSYLQRVIEISQLVAVRLNHYCKTGIWINESACLEFCYRHCLEDLSLIQRTFSRSVAQQYPDFLAHGSQPARAWAAESWLFFKRFCQDPKTVGSFFPSSPLLSQAIVKHIPPVDPNDTTPRRILEVGAGTGSFTDYIVSNLKPCDHLDIVEIDPEFCQILRDKFGHLKNVTIHEKSILDHRAAQYDVLVTGLPLNAFSSSFVGQVFDKYVSLTKQGGHISYFEYMYLPTLGRFFKGEEDKRDFDRIMQMKADFTQRYGESLDNVWFNLTPARVQHWQI